MAVEFIINRLKSLFIIIFAAFRRAMCCFRRRRRSSCDSIPLSTVGVIPNNIDNHVELQKWEQWEDNPVIVVSEKPVSPIQAKIQQYRQQIVKTPEKEGGDERQNFFDDMAPRITKQKKIIVRNDDENTNVWNASKFAVSANPIPTCELGEWEENSVGWEGETMEEFGDPSAILREERRKERERKMLEQHQRRIERNYRPQPLGAKISS